MCDGVHTHRSGSERRQSTRRTLFGGREFVIVRPPEKKYRMNDRRMGRPVRKYLRIER